MNDIVLKIARQAIEDTFNYTETINQKELIKENLWLVDNGASFVTLTQDKKLRGCIGSLIAQRPLMEDIISNANSAAFRDPRFPKLTCEELHVTKIEVSILTAPTEILYTNVSDLKSKIKPNIDGVILELNEQRATFLPQVWEELPDYEQFFGHLLAKAGLAMDSFIHHPTIHTYQVIKFKETN